MASVITTKEKVSLPRTIALLNTLSDLVLGFIFKNKDFGDLRIGFTQDIQLIKRLGVSGDFPKLLALDDAFYS
jgi:hypothetical protein